MYIPMIICLFAFGSVLITTSIGIQEEGSCQNKTCIECVKDNNCTFYVCVKDKTLICQASNTEITCEEREIINETEKCSEYQSSSVSPTPTVISTSAPTTPPNTVSSTDSPSSVTTLPTTTVSSPSSVATTADPTVTEPSKTTESPTPSGRHFDAPSFIGGIVLSLGLLAIIYVGFKFYKARTERNYHTLPETVHM